MPTTTERRRECATGGGPARLRPGVAAPRPALRARADRGAASRVVPSTLMRRAPCRAARYAGRRRDRREGRRRRRRRACRRRDANSADASAGWCSTHSTARPLSIASCAQQAHDLLGRFRIQARHRLVGEDQLRPLRQRPGDRRALRLAARQRVGALAAELLDADLAQQVARQRHFLAPAGRRAPSTVCGGGRASRSPHWRARCGA